MDLDKRGERPDATLGLGGASHSSFKQKFTPFFFMAWKNSLRLFVDRLRNQLKVVSRPFNI